MTVPEIDPDGIESELQERAGDIHREQQANQRIDRQEDER